mgnify:FL=1
MAPKDFSLKDFGVLREGLLARQAGTQPFKNVFGLDTGIDYTIGPQTVLSALPLGSLAFYGDLVGQVQTEQAANRFLNQDKGVFQTIQDVGKNTSAIQDDIKDFIKERNPSRFAPDSNDRLDREDIQTYFIEKSPQLDLAPLTRRTTNRGVIPEDTAFAYDYDRGNYMFTQPFSSGRFAEQMTGVTDETGLKGDDFKSAMGSYALSRAIDQNLKTPDQFAEDKITQSNIGQRDAEGNFIPSKTYDENFARSVTLEQQGDTANQGTFICTALYELGLLPRKIYMCDVIYGKNINFYTYKGYTLWGRWFAKQISKKQILYKIFSPFFIRWANQMAFEVSRGKYGKNNTLVKIIKRIGEKLNYTIGWISERRPKWNTQ